MRPTGPIGRLRLRGGADGRAQILDVPLAPSCSRALLYTPTPAAAPLDFLLRPRRSHAIRSTTRILFPCVVVVALATAARCTCSSRRRSMLALQRPRRDSFTTAKPRTRRRGRGPADWCGGVRRRYGGGGGGLARCRQMPTDHAAPRRASCSYEQRPRCVICLRWPRSGNRKATACLSLLTRPNFTRFSLLVRLPVAVARSSSGGVGKRNVHALPVCG